MDLITLILENGLTPPICLIVCGVVCSYLYKDFKNFINNVFKKEEKRFEIIENLEDLMKKFDVINNSVNKNVEDLKEKISFLERRITEIEKTDIKSSSEVSTLLKEIESIRKNMEMFNMMTTICKREK